MHDPVAQQFALACGVAGAYVDVSDDVITSSITRQWGRGSEFDDARPGVFSFALSNEDGKYTPGNASSSLATPLVEGMGVSWLLDGSLRSGSVRSAEPQFLADVGGGSSRVTVVVDDMLGSASRRRLGDLVESTLQSGFPYMLWPLNEDEGASAFAETWSGTGPPLVPSLVGVSAGSIASHIPIESQVLATDNGTGVPGRVSARTGFPQIAYGDATLGAFGFWAEHDDPDARWDVGWDYAGLEQRFHVRYNLSSGFYFISLQAGDGNIVNWHSGPPAEPNTPYFVSVSTSTVFSGGVWTITATLYIDGVSQGTSTYAQTGFPDVTVLGPQQRALSYIHLASLTGSSGTVYFSRLSHTRNPINETYIREGSADVRLLAIANVVPDITLDTPPAMSPAPLVLTDTSGQSALDAFNEVIRTEQGHIYTENTGTLTEPDQVVKARGRDRPETVTATFAMTEILYAPEFVRDISNMVSIATAIGPENSATWSDAELTQYVATASARDDVLLRDQVDLLAWAQDRIIRGKNVSVRIATFTIDALNTPTNRWADLTGLIPGDRIQITGLPSTQLGFSTLDGWLLGGAEAHSYPEQMLFTFHLQPVLPPTGIYDDDDRRYMAGGVLSLSADIDASVTTMDIATSDPATVFTTDAGDLPLVVTVGDEQIEITDCSGATPQVATIVRGVNGTTAAAHTAGDLIELLTETLYAF